MNEQTATGVRPYEKARDYIFPLQLICIEGNIGAGKSTLTGELARALGAHAMYEPVGDNPYLPLYYQDPKRYALEMQFWLMSRRFEMHEEAIRHIWKTGQSVIMDRSIYGDWVFAHKNYLDGNISRVGYDSYLHHREVMDKRLLAPHVVLYLDAPANICFDRIMSRGRECEKTISLSYLEGLQTLHDSLMVNMRERGSTVLPLKWGEFGEVSAIAQALKTLRRV